MKERSFKKCPEWRNFKSIFLDQIHSNIIHFIDRIPEENLKGDAMITNLPSILLIIKTADCLPILIVDESKKAIAAVHGGWRGTRKRVVQRAIQKMRAQYKCRPSELLVATGPCIGPECYVVGEDVRRSFEEGDHPLEFFRTHSFQERKYLFDLKSANLAQMVNLGVEREKIFSINICTHCNSDLPSFRRDKNKSGRMLSFIGLTF